MFRLTAPGVSESAVQAAVLRLLAVHPRVAWSGRFNSGAATYPTANPSRAHYVRFHTVPGFPDVAGQLTDGLGLYIECKRPGERLKPDQLAFLAHALWAHAVAGVARSVDDALRLLAGTHAERLMWLAREPVIGQGRDPLWPSSVPVPEPYRRWAAARVPGTEPPPPAPRLPARPPPGYPRMVAPSTNRRNSRKHSLSLHQPPPLKRALSIRWCSRCHTPRPEAGGRWTPGRRSPTWRCAACARTARLAARRVRAQGWSG